MYVLIIMATEVFRDMTLYDQSFWSYVGGCYIIFGCLAAIMTIAKLLYFMVKMLFTTNKESQNDV